MRGAGKAVLIGAGVLVVPLVLLLTGAAGKDSTARFTSEYLSESCRIAVNSSLDITSFSVCSPAERKVVYTEIGVHERSDLWREHLTSFLSPHSHLTHEQREVVAAVVSELDRYFGGGVDVVAEDGLPIASILAKFGVPLAREVFATLGTEVRYLGHTAGETRVLRAADGSVVGVSYGLPGVAPTSGPPSLPPYCTCRTGGGDFCCQGTCGDEVECITSDHGCGWLWVQMCNGLCGSWPE